MYSSKTGSVKPRFRRFRLRKRMRNVRLHARHYHLCYAFSTKRWISDRETVIIPGKISKITPQVPQMAEAKRQRHLHLGPSRGGIGEIGQDTEMRL
ncbi:hypothetical protein E2C01_029824 [Portunus trituberculatus]|uniref:Uncharacterized protein n=1 Tax=Portunus trituberculatus TaxID=210409 RepID=A0A5B7ETG4_PORTR|nr:hypothetical protein [Portunus trituberculatus]